MREQRLKERPLLVSQVVTIMHTSYLPHPARKRLAGHALEGKRLLAAVVQLRPSGER